MKHSRFYMLFTFLMINLFILTLNSPCFSQQQLPSIDLAKVKTTQLQYRLEIVNVLSVVKNEYFIPVDLDDDGKDEIIVRRAGDGSVNFIMLKNIEDNSVRFQKNFDVLISIPTFFDINNDGTKEIIVSEIRCDSSFIHVLETNNGNKLFSFLVEANPKMSDGKWDCDVYLSNLIDLNNDGRQDFLLVVHTGYGFQPRGIFAYDFHNKNYIWKFKTGFHVLTPQVIDINNDGQREILLGSSSPGNSNGRVVNKTDDEHTYLTVLNAQGNRLLNDRVIGKLFGAAQILINDLDNDRTPEIYVQFKNHRDPKEKSFIALWDPIADILSPKLTIEKDLSDDILFFDADRNGKDDILIGWSDGAIEIIDYNFKNIIFRKFPGFFPSKFFISDLNNDGEEEILVYGRYKGFNRIIIINRKLKLLACPDANLSIVAPNCFVNTGFGMDKLVLARKDSRTILMKMEKQLPLPTAISWNWLFYGLIWGVLITGIGLTIFLTKMYRKRNMNRMNSLINSLQEGLIILNSQGSIVTINQMMEDIFKMNRENIFGIPYKKAFSDSIFNKFVQVIDNSYQHKYIPIEQEITIFQKDKTCNLLVSIGSYPLDKKKEPGKLITMRNITEIVQSKRAIAWASLAQKLAHEIKTPLSTVMLTAQRLQMEDEGELAAGRKSAKYLNNIIEQVNRLRKMTDALMKFARIEAPKFESVNINDVIIECLQENRMKMGSGIGVEKSLMKDSSIIKADRQQLLVAFQNIIDNSITAMQGKGVLIISTTLVQSLHSDSSMVSKDAIQIEISDTGKGITSAYLHQLFQPFFSKFPDGTGLGLVIVKKIIDDHQGTIRIESKEGIGTTVFITLPA